MTNWVQQRVVSEMDALGVRQAHAYRFSGLLALVSMIVFVLAAVSFFFFELPAALERTFLLTFWAIWCFSATFVLGAYIWTGTIISSLGLDFAHVKVYRRCESWVDYWVFLLMLAIVLVLIGGLMYLAMLFVSSSGGAAA